MLSRLMPRCLQCPSAIAIVVQNGKNWNARDIEMVCHTKIDLDYLFISICGNTFEHGTFFLKTLNVATQKLVDLLLASSILFMLVTLSQFSIGLNAQYID